MNVFIDLFYKILLFQIRSRLTIFAYVSVLSRFKDDEESFFRPPLISWKEENFVLARIQLLTLPSIDLMFIATKRFRSKKS